MRQRHNDTIGRKAQIQLGETAAVIVIVIILLIIGIVFWNKVSSSDINKINTEAQELSVIEIANSIPELPELKCFESGASKVKCLDLYKIKAMNETLGDHGSDAFKLYNNHFKNSKITIMKLYPTVDGKPENITLYDARLNGSTTTLLIPVPVNIKDYVTKQTYYGLIMVEGYYIGK